MPVPELLLYSHHLRSLSRMLKKSASFLEG